MRKYFAILAQGKTPKDCGDHGGSDGNCCGDDDDIPCHLFAQDQHQVVCCPSKLLGWSALESESGLNVNSWIYFIIKRQIGFTKYFFVEVHSWNFDKNWILHAFKKIFFLHLKMLKKYCWSCKKCFWDYFMYQAGLCIIFGKAKRNLL